MADEQWYYAEGGQQRGPVSIDALRQLAATGRLQPGDLVWHEGMANWSPSSSIPELARIAAPQAPVYPAPGQPYGAAPHPYATPAQGYAPHPYGAPMQQGYAQGGTMGYYTPPQAHAEYAGFWLRFCAAFIDGLILLVPCAIIAGILFVVMGVELPTNTSGNMYGSRSGSLYGGTTSSPSPAYIAWDLITRGIFLVLGWLYSAFQESGPHMATFGKRAVGIVVTDDQGGRIGFGRASGRHFGKIISGCICAIGYIMAGLTEKKQGLHDMMASTLVIKKPRA